MKSQSTRKVKARKPRARIEKIIILGFGFIIMRMVRDI